MKIIFISLKQRMKQKKRPHLGLEPRNSALPGQCSGKNIAPAREQGLSGPRILIPIKAITLHSRYLTSRDNNNGLLFSNYKIHFNYWNKSLIEVVWKWLFNLNAHIQKPIKHNVSALLPSRKQQWKNYDVNNFDTLKNRTTFIAQCLFSICYTY